MSDPSGPCASSSESDSAVTEPTNPAAGRIVSLPLLASAHVDDHHHHGDDVEDDYKLHRRFDRMGRLVGDDGMARLFRSHVMVIGLGGVGSFAAEALVRSGVGHLSLIDFDRICVTNTNRQLQALAREVGRPKVQVLSERLVQINPQVRVDPYEQFYSEEVSDLLLGLAPDCVVDAIDNITAKCHLLSECRRRGIRVVSSLGAAGRMDSTLIRTADLTGVKVDPMGRVVRKILRQKHALPRKGSFGIRSVFSLEVPREPVELHYDGGQGFRCVCPGGKNDLHSCEKRRVIYGTSSWVTGSFGLCCAGEAIKLLLEPRPDALADASR
jgi:tRNA A37 threonylcarbamoyladenosine dehydratase